MRQRAAASRSRFHQRYRFHRRFRHGEFLLLPLTPPSWRFAVFFFRLGREKEVTGFSTPRGAREISNIAWACGKLRHQKHSLVDALAGQAVQILDEFISRDLSFLSTTFRVSILHSMPKKLERRLRPVQTTCPLNYLVLVSSRLVL